MNTTDRFHTDEATFSIEELESRFEMEAVHVPSGITPGLDWRCICSFES